jgi:Flp pilus assembly protein TadG
MHVSKVTVLTIKKYLKSTAGNVATIFSLAAVPLFAAAGAAMDMVRFSHVETLLQGAVDSAALAAATSKNLGSKAAMKKTIDEYLKANGAFDILQSVDSVTNKIDRDSGAITVSIKGTMSTNFMAVVGIPTMEAAASAEVNIGVQALDVALVLDNTGSMSGAKIADLKTASKQFVSILDQAKADYSDLRFGLVPFAKYVNVGTSNGSASWMSGVSPGWNGCVGSRNEPLDEKVNAKGVPYPAVIGAACPAPVTPLTTDTKLINKEIDDMVAGGNTYIPGGLLWGWNLLDPEEPFTEGMTKAQMKAVNGRKAIVLMTDGENTVKPIYPDHADVPSGVVATEANVKLTSVCEAVKADGIEVFTVAFQVPTPEIKTILVNCASAPDHAFDAANGAALLAAFTKIGQLLAEVRISK